MNSLKLSAILLALVTVLAACNKQEAAPATDASRRTCCQV